MRMITLCCLCLLVLTANHSIAQPALEWSTSYYDFGYRFSPGKLIATQGGDYMLVGAVYHNNNPGHYWGALLGVNDDGDITISETYDIDNDSINVYFADLISSNDNDYYVSGILDYYHHPDSTRPDTSSRGYLAKVDVDGEVSFERTYTLDAGTIVNSILQTEDDSLYLFGGYSKRYEYYHAFLMRTNEHGEPVWMKTFEDSLLAQVNKMFTDADGNLILTFSYWTGEPDYNELRVLKLDSEGELIWQESYEIYPLTWDYWDYDIVQTPDGGFLVVTADEPYEGDYRSKILRIADDGEQLWYREYDYNALPRVKTAIGLENGDILIGALKSASGLRQDSTLLVRMDSDCDILWSSTYASDDIDQGPSDMLLTPDGGYIVAGYKDVGIYRSVPTFFKTEPDEMNWVGSDGDFKIEEFGLIEAYPNPFNSKAQLSFKLPIAGMVNISLFDTQGRKIRNLLNEELSAGSHKSLIDGSELVSGAYMVRLQTQDHSISEKVFLLK